MNHWDIPELLFDPERDRSQNCREDMSEAEREYLANWDRKFNPFGIVNTLDVWVPWFPGAFPFRVGKEPEWGQMKLQKEALQGLLFPSEEACLNAMERYAHALDPWNLYVLFGGRYEPRPHCEYDQRGNWEKPPERQELEHTFYRQYEPDWLAEDKWSEGWDSRVTEIRTEREPGKLLITGKWEEKLPPEWEWSSVEWMHDGERVSERVMVHTARRLQMYMGAGGPLVSPEILALVKWRDESSDLYGDDLVWLIVNWIEHNQDIPEEHQAARDRLVAMENRDEVIEQALKDIGSY